MLPASNKGVGMNMGFPDVCLTPAGPVPVPIPYPNIAMNAMAAPFCPTILLTCMPALNMASMIPMTLGDQPGVANPLFMQMGRYTMGNPKILLEALPAINLTCPTTGNMMNNPVGAVLVPSVTNIFFTCAMSGPVSPHPARSGEGPAILDREAVREIVDAMSPRACSNVEVADLGGGAVHLRIRAFAATVASEVYGAIQATRPTAVVIDLRGNRGGELTAFLALAADFLPQGSELCTIVDAEGDVEVRRVQHDSPYAMPVVVIVDGATASAAELFAGCLQAHRRAIIVGERTTGKATRHVLLPFEDGAGYVTTGRCLLPGGVDLQGTGVTPDVAVTAGEDALRAAAVLLSSP
jgi:carboxyl-terminal processing protease